MRELPFGTVTFLFTDIEGSTKLWEQDPEVMKTALVKHDFILKEVIESNHGHIIKTTGDGVHAVFTTVLDSVTTTIAAQTALHSAFIIHAERSSFSLKVRMGIHTGEAELRDGDHYGGTLNRAARLMSVAHGGQVLLSNATMELVREQLPADVTLRDLGEYRLKDPTHPELPDEFPPIKILDAFPNNLPAQLPSFIGREKEINEIVNALNIRTQCHFNEEIRMFEQMGHKGMVVGLTSKIAHTKRAMGNYVEAKQTYRETIKACQDSGNRPTVAHQLECFAMIAIVEVTGHKTTDDEEVEETQFITRLHAMLSDTEFETLWAEGKSMPIEQAIQLALN